MSTAGSIASTSLESAAASWPIVSTLQSDGTRGGSGSPGAATRPSASASRSYASRLSRSAISGGAAGSPSPPIAGGTIQCPMSDANESTIQPAAASA